MNRIYRLIWNRTLGALVPVAEISRSKRAGPSHQIGRSHPRLAPLSMALALVLAPQLAMARQLVLPLNHATAALQSMIVHSQGIVSPSAHLLPVGAQVVSGAVRLSQSGSTLTINQSSANAIIDWQSFDIGSGDTVTFNQPDSNAVALNRVLGSDPSAIYGHLNANGRVFLVNPYGIYFAPGAQVNVGSIVASTLGITNQDFLAGRYTFSGSSTAGVRNDGTFNATHGGYVAFIGPNVSNDGSLTTPAGTTALGAGDSVTLTLAGDRLMGLKVHRAALDALARNGGLIEANGGRVILSAQARDALLQTVVNNTGRIQAQTVQDHDGTITLLGGDAGTVNVAGTLNASAPDGGNGGHIETSGAHVKVASSASITTQAIGGTDGHWLIDPQDFTIAASGGDMTGAALTSALGTGNVTIQSSAGATGGNGDIFVNDTVSWSANTLTLNAYRDIVINTVMKGSGTAGLALRYGQGSTNGIIGGGTADYTVNAPVNLASTGSFSTQLGSSASPISYTIITRLGSAASTTGTDLQGINGNLGGHYVLGADIDASATAGWNGGAGFVPLGGFNTPFTGHFDGLGHIVSGLTIGSGTIDTGLFGYTSLAVVRNVGLVGESVNGSNSVGGLVGLSADTTISNVSANGRVSGTSNVGGLVGRTAGSTISDAYATSSVTGNKFVGGLGGKSSNSTLSNAYATGSVSGTDEVGGLVGESSSSTISNAYATGSVSGTNYVGGLGGESSKSTINNAYATGSVSGRFSVGGLMGFNGPNSTISNGYWDTTTGLSTGIGSNAGTVNGGGGLTTAQLAAALPNGFSASAWANSSNQTTPYLLSNASFSTASGSVLLGSDTSTAPTNYNVITTLTQLQNINSTGLGLDYVLGGDIDAAATAGWNGGAGFVPLGNSSTPFTGIFNGLGHRISGLTIDRPSSDDVGLFGYTSNATVRNVGLVADSVQAHVNLGGLVGFGGKSTISNVYATGKVTGVADIYGSSGTAGGLVGLNSNGAISDAYATGSVSGNGNVGGLVGGNSGTIIASYATGSVTGARGLGGLVGVNVGTISDAYATGSVSGTGAGSERVIAGGLVGANSNGTISDAHATGNVSSTTNSPSSNMYHGTGGLVGSNRSGIISNAYATGNVIGTNTQIGGLVGFNFDQSTISNAYATGSVSGSSNVGGLVGINTSNSTVSSAYATGSVSGSNNVGGLVGTSQYTISNAYATGSVSGDTAVGGLVGLLAGSKISNAYATGSVTGTILYVGGLVGANTNGGSISNAYTTGSVSGAAQDKGGLVGLNGSNSTISHGYWDTTTGLSNGTGSNAGTVNGGGGLTTAQLAVALPTSFSASVWANSTNQTTPYLVANASFSTASGTVILGSDTNVAPTYYNVITTLTQLQNINSTGLGLDYVLGSDIDASATAGWNGGAGFVPLGNSSTQFTGIFDGLGYRISGLTINRPTSSYVGLFGYTSDASMRDIGLVGDRVSGSIGVGGLVGVSVSSTISNAFAAGNVSGGQAMGGLVGGASNSTISNSYATDSVSGTGSNVGGLVGTAVGNTTISNAYATGSVSGRYDKVGGLVGFSTSNSTVSNAYATGNVSGASNVGGLVGSAGYNSIVNSAYATGQVNGSKNVGGLIGSAVSSTISNAYAMGSVNGSSNVGGLVGINTSNSTLSNAYATGSVSGTGSNVGGLVGSAGHNSTINDAYATGSVSGTAQDKGGLVGLNGSNSTISHGYWDTTTGLSNGIGRNLGTDTGGGGLNSAQMMQVSNFTGFDFTSPVWVIYNGHSTPLLNAFLTPLTVTASNQTQTYDGSSFGLAGATYSVAGADTAGHLFGLTTPYDGAVNVGSYRPDLWSDQQGYRITYVGGGLTIIPKALTLSGLSADNKIYDGTTTATIARFGSLNGIVSGDSVSVDGSASSASFTDANAGIGKTVTINGLALSGSSADNYTLVSTDTTTADITPKTLTVSGLSGTNKTYDGTTTATVASFGSLSGVVSGDSVSLLTSGISAHFADANAGIGKTVTVDGLALSGSSAGNYTLASTDTTTADITPKTLTVSGLSGTNKTYDGTTNDTLSGTAALHGLVGSQMLTLGHMTSGTLASANAGSEAVSTALTLSNGTGLASNYTLVQPTLTNVIVSPAALTASLVGTISKVYNGTTEATLDAGNFKLTGFVGSQNASVTQTVGQYADSAIGTGIAVTSTLSSGDFTANADTLLANYRLPTTASGVGSITAAIEGDSADGGSSTGGGTGKGSGSDTVSATAAASQSTAWGYSGVDGFSALLNPRIAFQLYLPGKPTAIRVDMQLASSGRNMPSVCRDGMFIDPFATGKEACVPH